MFTHIRSSKKETQEKTISTTIHYRTIKDTNEIELIETWLTQNPQIEVLIWNAEDVYFDNQPPEYGMTQENWDKFNHEKHKM